MGERSVDLNFLDDLHSGGYVMTVAYIFNFLKEEINGGKIVHLEKKQGRKKVKTSIDTAHDLESFYTNNFKPKPLDVFTSNES